MPVSPTSGGAPQAPLTAPQQAPKNEPRKPQTNTAARTVPKETKSAVNNTFGPIPQDGKPTPAKAAPKTANLASDVPASAATGDPVATAAVDPRVQSLLDAKRADGKTVKEKLDTDQPAYIAKAAQDHYNKQKASGEALDNISLFYLNTTARYMAESGVKDAKIKPEQLADVFDLDKIRQNLDTLGKSPELLAWIVEQQANTIENTVAANPDIADLIAPHRQEGENSVNALRRMQSDYLTSAAFADTVGTSAEGTTLINDGLKTLGSLGLSEKDMLGVANTLAENVRSKYTPDAPRPVIDPNTNKPIQTDEGHNLAILPDGTNIAVGKDGKPVADKQGNAYVYNQDGTAKVDANNAYVQYSSQSGALFAGYGGIKYMVGPDGKARNDAQGGHLVIDDDGGAVVALGADGKVAVNARGNKIVMNPDTGKAVTAPDTGNAVIIDPATKGVVQAGADGKVVVGGNGDPYAADRKTGKFVQDAQGRYVQISKENAAPGIVPGYVVDANNTKVVVNPANGMPLVAPSLGKTVIFTPGTNAPALVPLDANGKPRLAEDGKNIAYDQGGNTVVTGTDVNWLVNADGKYTSDGSGHYIGVGPKTGLASPVDAKGAPVLNSNGQVPLWDAKTNASMTTADGKQIVLDKTGSLLQNDAEGKTIVEEKTGLPYLVDPRTKSVAVNPETGRWIMLDNSGAAVEYNSDNNTKYLINPATNTTVKTPEGLPITIDDKAGMPVARNSDGSAVKNPYTGNTVVYNIDGKPAVDKTSGIRVEVTPDGKTHLIDPKTQAPIGSHDKATGGVQLYNKDGSAQADPNNGNKVQTDPNGHRVEVDPATGKFAVDAFGNTLILGPGNTLLKTPAGNQVVADKQNGSPIAVDVNGKAEADPASGLPRFIHTETGTALEDPQGKASVVVDPKSGAPVHVDPKTGMPVKDPATGLTIVANAQTGAQAAGPNGEPIGLLPGLNVPAYLDKQYNVLTVADPRTGKAVTNPKTGAQVVVAPKFGGLAQVLRDKNGNLVLVDDSGQPRGDGLGNTLYVDKDTGQVVLTLPDGKVLDARTIAPPEKADPKQIVQDLPYLTVVPPGEKQPGTPATPAPAGDGGGIPPETPGTTATTPAAPDDPASAPPLDYPWARDDYTTTPAERAEYVEKYKQIKVWDPTYEAEARAIEALKKLPGNEALQDIPTEDLVAVRNFTGTKSRQINAALESGDPALLDYWGPDIKALMSGLNQMEKAGFRYNGTAVRFQETGRPNAPPFEEAGYFRSKQFISTSIDPDWFYEGDLRINFNPVSGVRVESISRKPDEQEVIVKPNKLIKNTSIDDWVGAGAGAATKKVDLKKITTASVIEPELPGTAGKGKKVTFTLPEDEIEIVPEPVVEAPTPETVPIEPEATTVRPAPTTPAQAKAAGRWNTVGKALGYAGGAFGIGTGILQAVGGGFQIDEGIKTGNPYDIASGTLNVASGALGIGSAATALAGGAAAAAAGPLAGAAVVFGMAALIVDILKHKDDHTKFAGSLGDLYEQAGILKEGWREKAAQAYYDAQGEPDPAPIAHGNNP